MKALLVFIQFKEDTDAYAISYMKKTNTSHPKTKHQSKIHVGCSWVSHMCFVMGAQEQCVCVYICEDGFANEGWIELRARAGRLPVVDMIALVGSPEACFM